MKAPRETNDQGSAMPQCDSPEKAQTPNQPTLVKCDYCSGKGFLKSEGMFSKRAKCSLCDGTGKLEASKGHKFGKLGFCVNCGWENYYLKKIGTECMGDSETAKRLRQEFGTRQPQPILEKSSRQGSGIRINLNLVLFLFAGLVLFVLPMMCSNPSANKTPDYLGSAEEKMDKGLPLNPQEVRAVNDVLGYKSDDEKAREIEKEHGE